MNAFLNFFVGPFLAWLPIYFYWSVFALAIFVYLRGLRNNAATPKRLAILAWIVLAFRIGYAAFQTAIQYYAWSQSRFTQIFLNTPLENQREIAPVIGKIFDFFNPKLGYFLFYSWGRFWITAILACAASLIFYMLLNIFHEYRTRFFEPGETELGFLTALIAGWPHIIVFIGVLLLSLLLISTLRLALLRNSHTTLGVPMLF